MWCAERGLSVFPIPSGSRKATLRDWPNRCTRDLATIRKYWPLGSNIGVGCRASGVLGVDLDRHHADQDGVQTFAELVERHGQNWPTTLTVRTPRDGLHLYFKAPHGGRGRANTSERLGPGIDTRGPGVGSGGGYLVGPGSVTPDGAYEVVRDAPIAPVPGWLLDLLDPPQAERPAPRIVIPAAADRYVRAAVGREVQRVLDAQPGARGGGGRNDALNRAAFVLGTLVGGGELAEDTVVDALVGAAEACGLIEDDGERAALATIRSGMRAGIARPRTRAGGAR